MLSCFVAVVDRFLRGAVDFLEGARGSSSALLSCFVAVVDRLLRGAVDFLEGAEGSTGAVGSASSGWGPGITTCSAASGEEFRTPSAIGAGAVDFSGWAWDSPDSTVV